MFPSVKSADCLKYLQQCLIRINSYSQSSANIRNCSDFKVYCREVDAYLLNNICKQFVNCIQGCITITNLYNIFIFYTISFYSPIFLLFMLQISIQFFFLFFCSILQFFILQFLTSEDPLGIYTVNKPLLLLLLLLLIIILPFEEKKELGLCDLTSTCMVSLFGGTSM